MFPQEAEIPDEVLQRIHAKLAKRALGDVLRICANHSIPHNCFSAEIAELIETLYQSRSYGVILSAYHDHGQVSAYTVTDLLLAMFAARDYPSFLKQALRFGFYHECPEQIEAAIAWHRDRGYKDADAWARKFADLQAAIERNS